MGITQRGDEKAPLITRHLMEEEDRQALSKPVQFSGSVLIAEDNFANQKLAVALVKKLGLDVVAADNGAEALEKLEESTFDIILMDWQMPKMDGLETTRIIRQREQAKGGHIPIIAVTANAMEKDRRQCLEAGMDYFISKPFTREDLVAAFQHYLPAAPQKTPMEEAAQEESCFDAIPDKSQNAAAINEGIFNTMHDVLGDEDFSELLSAYEESMAFILSQMPGALEANSNGDLERLAHSVKSASANIGAMRLSDLAWQTEEQASNGKLSSASKNIAAMQAEFSRVQEFLDVGHRAGKQLEN